MCTGQLYRIVDFTKVDRVTGQQKVFFYSDKNRDVFKTYPHPRYLPQQIPCGHCWECKVQKAKEWAFRCMKEAKQYDNNIMLTLTYDDEHIPKTTYIDEETGEVKQAYTLSKDDHQKFMKRLRKAYPDCKIKFMLAGEYGSDNEYIDNHGNQRRGTERPHYHIICFNLKIDDLKFHRYSKCEWSKDKNPLFKSKTIDKLWNKGHVDLNEVNYETCCYVARYTTKKLFGEEAEEKYTKQNRVPPYLCMSRNPGIGNEFYEQNKEKFMDDKRFYQMTKKGLIEVKPGRYFDKQLEKDNPERLMELKHERIKASNQYYKDLMSKTDIELHEYIQNQEYRNQQIQRKLHRS